MMLMRVAVSAAVSDADAAVSDVSDADAAVSAAVSMLLTRMEQ